jgi:alanine-synthesizing transaminase
MFAQRTNWNLSANRLAEALARHRAAGRKLLDLTASNPTECGFKYAGSSILKALINPGVLHYRPDPRGLKSARQTVCGYYYADRGDRVATEDIILTTSTSEAYSYVFRLVCNPGDELLVPAPSYPLFEFLADIQDVTLVRYPLFYDHGWHIDFHALEQAITEHTRGIIVVHPNNPTGHFTKRSEIEKLTEIAAAHSLAIVADEVFLDFSLQGAAPSFVSNHRALTFTLSGLSKISGLPQMKLSWLIVSGPQEQKREALARLEVIADTYLSPSTPIQLAVPALLAQRYEFQEQLLARVRRNLTALDAHLAEQKSCSRLEVEGGWYAVLRVPATRPDEDLAVELLEKHSVYLHPGGFFGFSGDGYLVVSLITPEAEFDEGMGRVVLYLAAAS